MKQFLKILCSVLGIFLLVALTILAYLSVDEYKPAAVEGVRVDGFAREGIKAGEPVRIMTWNIGYGALGDNADFFMDGGKMVYSADKDRVMANLFDDLKEIEKVSPDIVMMQEVDRNSARSYYVDEVTYFKEKSNAPVLSGVSTFAPNFNVSFIPLPIPPIGKVYGGLETYSRFNISAAERIQLPCPFSWPLRTINLKRCLLVSRIPVKGSDKELVLVNLHLEAYDSGEGKIAQANMLKETLLSEVEKGNYVIAGGDFNQLFSNIDSSKYPNLGDEWQPGLIDTSEFGSNLSFNADASNPTCRSLERTYADAPSKDPQDFQYYVIDGFITSSNIKVEKVNTDDTGFVSSDHNPVIMDFILE